MKGVSSVATEPPIADVPLKPKKRTLAERSRRLLVRLLIYVLVLLIMLAWFQRSLIYHPTKSHELQAATSALPQAVVDVRVTTDDKLVLNGWLALAGGRRTSAAADAPKLLTQGRPLVIVFPGNAGNRAMREYLLQALGSLGADAMIFDHRGFGDNEGRPTEADLIRDARTIWNYATKELKVPPGRIVLYGESLGTGVATRLAGDLCAEGIEPGGLIVQSAFNSLVATGHYHFPILPVSLLLIDRFESDKHITRVTCPILHLHGRRDSVVPLPLGEKLFGCAPGKSSAGVAKEFVLLPNTDHNDVYGPDVQSVMKAVGRFLDGVNTREKNGVPRK
jgi:fermentation-respiration switch protein FrsA (DUF1100 family)